MINTQMIEFIDDISVILSDFTVRRNTGAAIHLSNTHVANITHHQVYQQHGSYISFHNKRKTFAPTETPSFNPSGSPTFHPTTVPTNIPSVSPNTLHPTCYLPFPWNWWENNVETPCDHARRLSSDDVIDDSVFFDDIVIMESSSDSALIEIYANIPLQFKEIVLKDNSGIMVFVNMEELNASTPSTSSTSFIDSYFIKNSANATHF
eukprot:609604_1